MNLQIMEKKEPNLKSTAFLRDSLLDAEIILSHASEFGISINPKYIKAVVNAKRNEQNNSWNEQEEIDFWIAFQVLSKAIQPVSIDSLRAASEPKEQKFTGINKYLRRKKKSLVKKSVTWYQSFALISMFVMIALQIYALIGTAQLAKYNEGVAKILEIQNKMQSLILITSTDPDNKSASNEKSDLETLQEEITLEMKSEIQLLESWLNFTPNIISKGNIAISRTMVVEQAISTGNSPLDNGNSVNIRNVVIIQQTKSLVIILNQYILPLLYGLLGGFAFVLREVSREAKAMTYTPISNIKYGLRIHLGALAGLVIGFLWGDLQGKSFGVVESLSPLAVAFLAGYSVDFLFRLLDSIIGTARNKISDSPAAEKVVEQKG